MKAGCGASATWYPVVDCQLRAGGGWPAGATAMLLLLSSLVISSTSTSRYSRKNRPTICHGASALSFFARPLGRKDTYANLSLRVQKGGGALGEDVA